MKKILIVVPNIGFGGQQKIAINTARCLKDDYNVFLAVFQRCENEYMYNGKILDLHLAPIKIGKVFNQLRRARKLAAIRKKEKIDIVYSIGFAANLSNVISGMFSLGSSVVSLHGMSNTEKKLLNKIVLQHAKSIICISQEMMHQLIMNYPYLMNTQVIENGYDVGQGNNKKNYTAGAPRFVAMGRLDPVKRYDILIKIFAEVIKDYPNAHLDFLGTGILENKLKVQTEQLGLAENVTFLGYQREPYQYMQKDDIFLMTSESEGFPNSLIEAMDAGLVAISVDCISGPREILSEQYHVDPIKGIQFEKYGILVENTSNEVALIQLFKDAVLQLLRSEPKIEYYKTIAPQRACAFSMDEYRRKLQNLIENL